MEKPPRSRTLRRVLAGAGRTGVALLAVAVLAGTGYVWVVSRTFAADLTTSSVLATRAGATAAVSTPRRSYTALLVGLDSRTDAQGEPLPPDLLAEIHAGDDGGELHTDTIMLVRVPADPRSPVVTVSFPRDSYVPLADGSGRHKINSAYGRAYRAEQARLEAQGVTGAELDRRSREAGRANLVATVEAVSGTTVDHYAELNLAGFVELTGTLGGVNVCLNQPVDDRAYSGVDLPAGPQSVSGAAALAFVRQRHGLDGGDLDRITRQQAFLAGLAHQVLAAGTLADPATVSALLGVVTRHVVVDSGWDLRQLVGQLGGLAGGDVVFRTIPSIRPDLWTPVDGVAVEIDDDQVRDFVHTVLFTDARADGTAPETPDPDASRVKATGPTPSATPSGTPTAATATSAVAPTTTIAVPEDQWQHRPLIDAAAVPCVN
ncbi:LCP family protein [Pseudonocardia halophobica]|uniref:LytTR family transcriptional regulator n=1 Tax=Pseudonocardia halophobica TaxID=29401 RepID=A0A9W6L913_9PSEU|nr:LCP family protein [Pseudonocardia halophobica]GLL13134.1 LytTR family transcriptional regulator [Pseudonocardia halophobica]